MLLRRWLKDASRVPAIVVRADQVSAHQGTLRLKVLYRVQGGAHAGAEFTQVVTGVRLVPGAGVTALLSADGSKARLDVGEARDEVRARAEAENQAAVRRAEATFEATGMTAEEQRRRVVRGATPGSANEARRLRQAQAKANKKRAAERARRRQEGGQEGGH